MKKLMIIGILAVMIFSACSSAQPDDPNLVTVYKTPD